MTPHRAIPFLRAAAAIALAFVAPPLSVALTRGTGAALAASAILSVGGVAVFRFLYAGPGLVLFLLAAVQAVALAVRPARAGKAAAAP